MQHPIKPLRAAVAAALSLAAFSAVPAFAQNIGSFGTVGTPYPTADVGGFSINSAAGGVTTATVGPAPTGTVAPGNSVTLAQFSSDVDNAYTNNLGGIVGFDEAKVPNGTNGKTFTAAIGASGSTLTVTSPSTRTYSVAGYTNGSVNGNLPFTSTPSANSGLTVPNNGYFIGISGNAPATGDFFATYNAEIYNFSQPLSEFGITATARGSAYDDSLWVQTNGSTTWTLISAATEPAATSAANGDKFFEYSAGAADGSGITAAALVSYNPFATGTAPGGFERLDDFAFVVAAPEPSSWLALALGAFGLGTLALRARRRGLTAA